MQYENYEPYTDEQDYRPLIDYVSIVEDGYVKSIPYCTRCNSVDIKKSKAGNMYCGKICRKNKEKI